jgi:hypothetical protein
MLTETDLAYTLNQLSPLVDRAQRQYHRLLWLCGGDWQTRSQVLQAIAQHLNWPYLAAGLPLTERLLPRAAQQRSLHLERELEALLPASAGIILDHLEILFDADLRTNPLQLLERLARERTVIASWPGKVQSANLVYAEPWHAEYRTQPLGDRLCYALP